MEDDYRSSKRKMSWDPNQEQSGSSASSSLIGIVAAAPSSSSSSSSASLPRSSVQSSGLVSHPNSYQVDRSPRGDRLRLPPLSSLITSSDTSRSSPSPRSPSNAAFNPNQEWSPSKSQTSTIIDIQQSSQYPHQSSHYRNQLKQDANQGHHVGLPLLRRSNSSSTSGTSTPALNLPPLTTLSIRPASQSPSEVPSSFIIDRDRDRDHLAPRLPSTIQSSSSRHRPYPVSSSLTERSIGPTRRRWTGESASVLPYDHRPSPPSDVDYFNHVWDIYSYACRVNDDAAGMMRHTYPTIAHSDIKMLVYYLNRELDRLDQFNPQLSMKLAQDAGLTNQANKSIHQSTSNSSSTSQQQQHHSQSWKEVNRRTSPNRDSIYHTPDHPAVRRGSHGEVFTTKGSMDLNPSHRSLQASPRTMHHQSQQDRQYTYSHHPYHYSSQYGQQQQQQYNTDVLPPPSFTTFGLPPSASSSSSSALPKRVRKRKDEAEQSCLSCSATETPEWRKGPTGPRTLCNACGLLFAKQCRKKELDAQARGERPKGSRSMTNDIMTMEEKEKSLAELRIAVNARAANGSPPI